MRVFKALVQEFDLEWEYIDGSIVKVHQHSTGAVSEENQAIGISRRDNTTTIHMAVDITGGEVHDCKIASEFIETLPPEDVTVADRAMLSRVVALFEY